MTEKLNPQWKDVQQYISEGRFEEAGIGIADIVNEMMPEGWDKDEIYILSDSIVDNI